MRISLIAAVAANRVIGKDGGLPWRLPADLRFFRRMTLGKPLLMGRTTFLSLGKPLPGRTNIVISRGENTLPDGVCGADSIPRALEIAQAVAGEAGEVMVIGGGQIYAQTLALAQTLYLTEIAAAAAGDTLFPEFALEDWRVERATAQEENGIRFLFATYSRQGWANPTG